MPCSPLHTQASGPLHRSCALYAALACPFLRYSKSRRRVTGDGQRGTLTLHGFDRYAVVFPSRPQLFMTFAHYDTAETVSLRNLAHVSDLYQQALTTDTAGDFATAERLYWTAASADKQRLAADWVKAWDALQSWAQTSSVTIDGNSYRGLALT